MPINLPRSITSRFTTISYGQQQIILFKFMDLVKLLMEYINNFCSAKNVVNFNFFK